MRTHVFVVALYLGLASLAGHAAEERPALFADTAQNRALVDDAFQEFRRIADARGHFIEVNGINMHYLEWGDDTGVPLIWSHGYTSTGYELINVGPELAALGYHVFAITYRGHGQTKVEDYRFSLSHVADDISAMMEVLGLDRAVIGGLSLGGGVTTAFYDHYADKALAVVLEDGGADPVQARTERLFPSLAAKSDVGIIHEELVFDDRFSAFQAFSSYYLPGWGVRYLRAQLPCSSLGLWSGRMASSFPILMALCFSAKAPR
ncbi:hypothetical protein NOR53_2480 [gamma proteobacterium NOR5-3]|nr:hypothetical protein NOR53_2480 [gamma proteobacterium NOR5-3]